MLTDPDGVVVMTMKMATAMQLMEMTTVKTGDRDDGVGDKDVTSRGPLHIHILTYTSGLNLLHRVESTC